MRRVYKQPPVKGKVLYRSMEPDAPEKPDAPGSAAQALVPEAPSAAASAEGAATVNAPAVTPDRAAIAAAVAALAEQEKEKWARVGYEQGYKQGREEAEAEIAALRREAEARLKEAELCLREARQRSREIVAASEAKVVELAVAAAERLLQTQLELAPDKIIHIVREAMRLMTGERITVFVSPADLGACLSMQEQIKKEFTGVNRLEFLPDGALERGSCRVESENGTVEYLLHEEGRRLKELLLDLARREESKLIAAEEEPPYGRH